jgi:hypothetical protein
MKADPALGALCKTATFNIADESWAPIMQPQDFASAGELLSWLPNLKAFHVHGGFIHHLTWPLVRNAFKLMPNVKNLKLSHPVWDVIQTMQLESLTLYGVDPERNRLRGSLDVEVNQ